MRFFILMILLVSFKLQSQHVLYPPALDEQVVFYKESPHRNSSEESGLLKELWGRILKINKEEKRNGYAHLIDNNDSFKMGNGNVFLNNTIPEKEFINFDDIDFVTIIISIFVIKIIIILIILHIQKYKIKVIEKYEEIIQKTEKNNDKGSKFKVSITDNTLNQILEKLEDFEKNNEFTRKDTSLPKLSHQLQTNTTYLSEVIKQYKKNNFNGYINHLRIEYIINKLHEDPIFREYKISYLAEKSGFASREVFTTTFKKEKGISPSHFIKELKDSKK